MKFKLLPLTLAVLSVCGVASAEKLTYLNSSDLALAQRFVDIENATQSIDLTTLEWDPCSTVGKVMTKKLREKANGRPKVKVRLLLDAYFQWNKKPNGGNKLLSQMQTHFVQQGIDFNWINPPGFGPSQITGGNIRSHSKLMVIDGKSRTKGKFISGGRNITDAYFGMAKENLMDRDVAVTNGSAVTEATYGFDALWDNKTYTRKVGYSSAEQMKEFQSCTAWGPREAALEAYMKKNAEKILAQAKRSECKDVLFTIDDMNHSIGGGMSSPYDPVQIMKKPTSAEVFRFMNRKMKRLVMENQYYIPMGKMDELLQQRRREKTDIKLYSNLFDNSTEKVRGEHARAMRKDNVGTQQNHSLSKISGMIDKWDFTPRGATYSIHSKTFVADGKDAIVSSFNIDPRSQHTNGESAVSARNCPAFAKQVEDTANLTASVWKLEERLSECRGSPRPAASPPGPFDWLIHPELL